MSGTRGCALVVALLALLASRAPRSASAASSGRVFISAKAAAKLVRAGATLLDARGGAAKPPFARGARVVGWKRLRSGGLRSGKLASAGFLRRAFAAVGVSAGHPVVVYGEMRGGWGEEGRIWWTLRYLGHPRVYIVDGGIAAWRRAKLPTVQRPQRVRLRAAKPLAASKLRARLRASAEAVNRARRHGRRGRVKVLDARRGAEYRGKTPYGAQRGGHVPGAKHLYWKSLIGRDGKLLPVARIRARLAKLGVRPSTRLLIYCTGGVRSAFVAAALQHAGFPDVANYDGSWWEWAARRQLPVAR